MRKINQIVLHCTATQCNAPYPPASMLRDHKARGFTTYGYHYYIRRDGTIEALRPIEAPGAHAKGYNSYSIGICYEGGLNEAGKAADTRTEAQKTNTRDLVERLLVDYPEIKRIDGHRDLSPDLNGNGIVEPHEWVKMCPCFDVHAEYNDLLK